MAKVGGPTDSRSQGYMLRFPRPNDTEADLITLRGKSSIIEKLRTEILAAVGELSDRIIMGLEVPRASHAVIIGRSGSNVNELQSKHNVKIVFPNWKEASAMGALENAEEVKDVEPENLLRIVGSADACAAVSAAIKVSPFTPLMRWSLTGLSRRKQARQLAKARPMVALGSKAKEEAEKHQRRSMYLRRYIEQLQTVVVYSEDCRQVCDHPAARSANSR